MISWPAANEIRWVNPSIATVSPSWTNSATASRIVVTLSELIRRPPVLLAVSRPAEHTELVPLDVFHDGPEGGLPVDHARLFLDVVDLGGAEPSEPVDLLAHGPGGPQVQMHAVLRGFWLGHRLEEDPAGLPTRVCDV